MVTKQSLKMVPVMETKNIDMPGFPPGCEPLCQGCLHRTWTAEKSEAQKFGWVQSKLSLWADRVEKVRGVPDIVRWGYREKVCLHAEWKKEKAEWAFGLLIPKSDRKYEVLSIPQCPIHSKTVNQIVQAFRTLLPSQDQLPLSYLVISGTLVTLVVKSKVLPQLPSYDWKILGITGFFVNLHPAAGNRIYSSKGWHHLWGERHGFQKNYQFGPDSFQQLIPSLYKNALEETKAFLKPNFGDGVLDFYSGIGLSLQLWRDSGANFLGVELGGSAVKCAEMNVGAGYCLRGRASERLPQMEVWLQTVSLRNLLIFANPPRTGLEPKVLKWISELARPKRISYLSCNAGTLFNDLKIFVSQGYQVVRVIPYDFFPQTHHVEILTLLERKN